MGPTMGMITSVVSLIPGGAIMGPTIGMITTRGNTIVMGVHRAAICLSSRLLTIITTDTRRGNTIVMGVYRAAIFLSPRLLTFTTNKGHFYY